MPELVDESGNPLKKKRNSKELRRLVLWAQIVVTLIAMVVASVKFYADYQRLGTGAFSTTSTRVAAAEIKLGDIDSQISSIESKLSDMASKLATLDSNSANLSDPDFLNSLALKMASNVDLAAELSKTLKDSPTKGFLTAAAHHSAKKQTDEAVGELTAIVEQFRPVYDAIDIKNRENTLAVPLIRKDIDTLQRDLAEAKRAADQDRLALTTELATETSRIYDLGKWFLGLLVVACVLPLIEPLFKRLATPREKSETSQGDGASDDSTANAD